MDLRTLQEEDRLARQQREAATRAAASSDADAQHPAAAAVDAAAARLAGLFAALGTRRRLQGLVAAAQRLGLRESSLPRPLLKVTRSEKALVCKNTALQCRAGRDHVCKLLYTTSSWCCAKSDASDVSHN